MKLYNLITIAIAMVLVVLIFTPETKAASEEEEESTSDEPQQTEPSTTAPAPIRPGPFRPGPFRPPFRPFPFFRPFRFPLLNATGGFPGRPSPPSRPFPFPILPPLNFSGNPISSNSPGSLVSNGVVHVASGVAPVAAEQELYFPPYSIDPPRIVNGFPSEASDSSASSDSSESSDSSVSSSESISSEEDDDESLRPEGRTFFLIFRLLQLLSQQNSTSSG
ncbi:unnamed protein product [Ceratitis capitata]|uniref:(Mediterranean fruit fly) hypothetical protein n=2 Tax=Ceratitis capitata TaxID=7213 RepID=A0A811U5D3_CERCA|nr:unnamed protein product [Ceratitis capitata]